MKDHSLFKHLILSIIFCYGCLFTPIIAKTVPINIEISDFEILQTPHHEIQNIHDAIDSKQYKRCPSIEFGYTDQPRWLRFKLPKKSGGNYVVLGFHSMDYVNFYYVNNNLVIDSLATGYLRPISTRELNISRFVMSLPDDAHQGWVYLKLQKKEGTLLTNVFIQDRETLNSETHFEETIITFFLGVSFLMLMFALAYFIYFKLTMFLWYALWIFSFVFQEVTNYGYGSLYLWGDNYWLSNTSRIFWMVLALLSALMFAYRLLKVKEYCPTWTTKIFNVFCGIFITEMIFIFLPVSAYPWRFYGYVFHIFITIFLYLFLFYITLKAVKQHHIPAYFFFSGEMVLLLTFLFLAIRNFGFIPSAWMIDHIIFYLGILVMSLALLSMIAYTRSMHVITVKEELPPNLQHETKPLSAIELKKLDEIYEQLEHFFKIEHPYLNTNIDIDSVADKLNTPAHLLSKSVNTKSGKHFFDYVNSFRIDKARQLLRDPEIFKQYNIQGIAGLCGFTNKTSFNKAFKKFTGTTPSSYRNEVT